MRLWTKRDGFVPVAATGAGGREIGREQGRSTRPWNDCGSPVTVAATGSTGSGTRRGLFG